MPTSPSPPTSRVGFLLIRTSLSSFGSWDCRPLGPWVVVLWVLGLSSFWSWDCRPLGPGIVVLLVLGLSSFGSWDCRPIGPWVLGLSSFGSLGPGIVVLWVLWSLGSCRPYGPPDGWLSLC
ncbi:hypothetical protein B9Z19DRAFT_609765 [Tuber borchii]|uniref:Uncharacterized protein n=1 Tax=Tuber borchii TaxID=42251 RepID=A0A2T7A0Z2_TUBBO|nr:hypothetical protein B9Z19DRAFT_609765 [Tuber borchii]